MNRLELVEKLALHKTLDQSIFRYIEKAYRHYSKTYHTPLHIAEEVVPEEKVLLIYFEDQIENVATHELADIINDIYALPELEVVNAGGQVRSNMPQTTDDEWIARMNKQIQAAAEDRERKKLAAKEAEEKIKAEAAMKDVDDVISKFNKSMTAIKSSLTQEKKK